MPVVGVTMDVCVQPPLSTHVEGRSLSVGHASCGHDDGEDVQHHRCRADLSFPTQSYAYRNSPPWCITVTYTHPRTRV